MGLAGPIFDQVNAHLARSGQSLGGWNDRRCDDHQRAQFDEERRWQARPRDALDEKSNQWFFGMKAHIGVDDESGLVHHVECTAANVADVTQVHKLLHGAEDNVFGDSGYTGAEKRAELGETDAVFLIAAKPSTIKAMKQARAARSAAFRATEGECPRQGRAPVPGHEAAVRLHEGALSRAGQKRGAGIDAVRFVESVDVAPALAAGSGVNASAGREVPSCGVKKRATEPTSTRVRASGYEIKAFPGLFRPSLERLVTDAFRA